MGLHLISEAFSFRICYRYEKKGHVAPHLKLPNQGSWIRKRTILESESKIVEFRSKALRCHTSDCYFI
jgi:hypothetical protein